MNTARLRGMALTATALLISVACGSSNTDAEGTAAEAIAPEVYAAGAVEAYCSWLTPCCAETVYPIEQVDCESFSGFAEQVAKSNPANYDYDGDLAAACLERDRQLYAARDCDMEGTPEPSELDCADVFTGKLELGAPCATNIECAEGPRESALCGLQEGGDGELRCKVIRRGVVGDPCTLTCWGDFCMGPQGSDPFVSESCNDEDGVYCRSGYCEAISRVGDPCESEEECELGTSCNGECTALAENGAACTDNSDCRSGLCNDVCESFLGMFCTAVGQL